MSDYNLYEPKTWRSGEFITRTALNHIEQGIYNISNEIIRLESGGIGPIAYDPISITSLAINPNKVEIGSKVLTYKITASINKMPTSLVINGHSYDPTQSFILDKVLPDNEGITSNTTWAFNVTDEHNTEDTKSITLYFLNKAYWGAAIAPSNINSEFILGLSNSTLTDSRARKITVTAGENQYIWYAVPHTFGACTFTVGGWNGGFTKVDTISYTNASGHTEDYDIYRSINANLDETSVTIS